MFRAKVILDSVGPNGKRLISVEATYPRFIHAELMTHRAFSRNAASSRAIPWIRYFEPDDTNGLVMHNDKWLHPKCMMAMIMSNPVIPLSFDGEQKGMQSAGAIENQAEAARIWLAARDVAVIQADLLADLGVHKSICNRLTEPFMWITTLITATEWNNFFRLRVHPSAEKHFQFIASMIKNEIANSKPQRLKAGEWHMPYLRPEDAFDVEKLFFHNHLGCESSMEMLRRISAARCARLSYLTHDGVRNLTDDIGLFDKLIQRNDDVIHASPTEHVAEASDDPELRSGNFHGWRQFRKQFPNENVPG